MKYKGALLKVASGIFFALINGIVRHLSKGENPLSSQEIAFFQNFFGVLFMLPWMLKVQHFKSNNFPLQIGRVMISAAGIVLWYKALSYMPIAQAVALGFLSPLITTLGASLFLKERLGWGRSNAILLGVLGSFFVVYAKYLNGTMDWFNLDYALFLPLGSALMFSISTLMNKKLTSYDSPSLISFYMFAFMAPLLLIPSLYGWKWPSLYEWPWLISLGVLSTGAYLSLTHAFKCADLTFLIPFGFTRLFASAAVAYLAFSEIPSTWVVLGAFIICLSLWVLGKTEQEKSHGTKH